MRCCLLFAAIGLFCINGLTFATDAENQITVDADSGARATKSCDWWTNCWPFNCNPTIPDACGFSCRVNVNCDISGALANSKVTRVDITYNILHTYIGDLVVEVSTQRNGVWYKCILHDREGGNADDISESVICWDAFDGLDPNGTWYLVAWDEAPGDVGEIEDFAITVHYDPALPDLIVEDIWTSPTTPCAGQQATIYVKVKNIGLGAAGSSRVNYKVNGTQIGDDDVSSLSPGQSTTENIPYTFGTPGSYNIKCCADYTFMVGETDGSNNCLEEGKTVQGLDVIVTVKNQNNSPRSNATVIQYEIINNVWYSRDQKTTNSSGNATWNELNPGAHWAFEAYYNGEFWGNKSVFQNSCTQVNPIIKRTMPYADLFRVFNLSNGQDVTGGTVMLGTPLQFRVRVRNDDPISGWNTRMSLTVDRSKSSPFTFFCSDSRYISSSNTYEYLCNWTPNDPNDIGLFNRKLIVDSYVNNNWVLTDSWAWDPAVTVICPKPPSPVVQSISPNPICIGNQYCVSWSQVSDADFYEISENGDPWISVGSQTQKCYTKSSPGIFKYRVRSVNECGPGNPSNEQSVEVITFPSPPSWTTPNPITVCVGEQLCIGWSSVPGATSYEVMGCGTGWENVGGNTQKCVTLLQSGSCTFQVRALGQCGSGNPSTPLTVNVIDKPQAPIVSGPGNACIGQEFCITWGPVQGADSYIINVNGGQDIPVGGTQYCPTESQAGTYCYTVKAVNQCGPGLPSNPPVCVNVGDPPSPPSVSGIPQIVCTEEQYCISWTPVYNADSYEIRENGGQWIPVGNSLQQCYTKQDKGTYTYEVRSINACGPSNPSEPPVSIIVEDVPDKTVATVQPTEVCTGEQYCISWSAVPDADSYEISENSGSWTNVGPSLQQCYPKPSSGLFQYRVRAVNQCGPGVPSDPIDATVIDVPDRPVVTVPSACSGNQYCVIWNAVLDATSYEIQEDGGQWTPTNNTQMCYTKPAKGVHEYRVRAVNQCGPGEPSYPADTVFVRGAPDAPTASVLPQEVCLEVEYCVSWTSLVDAEWYEIRENGGAWVSVNKDLEKCYSQQSSGTYTYEVRGVNGCAPGTASNTVSVLVKDDPPPVIESIADKTIMACSILTVDISATDPSGATITLSPVSMPSGASFEDNLDGTGEFVWTPSTSDEGVDTFSVSAQSNDCGAADTSEFAVTVTSDDPPVISIDSITFGATEGTWFEISYSATDPQSTPIAFSLGSGPSGSGVTDEGAEGTFAWVPAASQIGTFSAILVATDECGSADSVEVTITVVENEPPEFPNPLPDESYTQGDVISMNVLASDYEIDMADNGGGGEGSPPWPGNTRIYLSADLDSIPASESRMFTDNGDGTGVFTWTTNSSTTSKKYPIVFFATDSIDEVSDTVILDISVGISRDLTTGLPERYTLDQNYPNPFNPVTNFRFAIPYASHVKVSIFSISGRRIAMIFDGGLAAGWYDASWDASGFASGVYFYRLEAGQFTDTKKMILLK